MSLILKKNRLLFGLMMTFSLSQSFAGASLEDSLVDDLLGIDDTFSSIQVYGDVQLRGDIVRDLPRVVDPDFERATARARIGIIWTVNEFIDFGAAAKVNWSTESNARTRFNLDNERADDISIDELFTRINVTENTSLLIGQSVFPLTLSPMLWDDDLRPQGVSLQHRQEIGDFSSFEFIGGVFLGNHLFGDSSRINSAQAALRFGEGTAFGYHAIVSILDFGNLGDLSRNSLRRTNSPGVGGSFAEDFNIVDIQLGTNISWKNVPIRASVDLLKNVDASDKAYGGRVDLVLGNSHDQRGVELGVAAQRIQQDAVVAPFNDDNWWFATNMRGVSGWVAYGFNDSLRAKLAVFHERLDPLPTNNNRALLDLQYTF